MPKLPVPTAQGQNQVGLRQFGVLSLPSPQPESYGFGIGVGMQQAANAMLSVDEKLRDQRDRLDLSKMSLEFSLRMDAAKHAVLTNGEIPFEKKGAQFGEDAQTIINDVQELGRTRQAKEAFAAWATGQYGHARLDIEHEGRKIEAQNQLMEGQQINEGKLDRAAKYPLAGFDTKRAEVENVFREVIDKLNASVKNGLMYPADAEKEKDRLFNRYWEQRALNDPLTIMRLASTGESVANMDMGKMGHYVDIASAVITKIRTEQDRAQKEQQNTNIKAIETIMWGSGGLPGRDATLEIESQRPILTADQFRELLQDNKKLTDMRSEITPYQKRVSERTQVDLLELAKRAKYEPDLLKHIINNRVVRDHVFNKKDLLPDDAAPILTAISEAIGHQESSESSTRRAQTDAMKSLDVFTPQNLEPKDAFALKNVEDAMKRELRAELDSNPNLSPTDIQSKADDIRARGEKRIVGLQKLKLENVDEELFGMEQLWKPYDVKVSDNHQIEEKQRKQLEQQFPLLRGLFRLHDERRKRWEDLRKVGQSLGKEGEAKRGK